MSAENCYKLLHQLSGGALTQTTGIPGDTDIIKMTVGNLKVTVISRDLRGRPYRVGLMTSMTDQSAAMPLRSIVAEIQLYHDYQIAVPLAFQEGARSYIAFDQHGRLLASRLAELTEALGDWLCTANVIPVAGRSCEGSGKSVFR